MDNPSADLSSFKQQLELDEHHPEAVKYYTQMKEELEKSNEEMRGMYGRLLMRMIEVTRAQTSLISMKRTMKIAHDNMETYDRERRLAENENNIKLKK